MSSTVRHRKPHATAALLMTLALCCTALLLGGCGTGRVIAPNLAATVPNLAATAQPAGFVAARYPADGVALSVPRDWSLSAEKSPLVAVVSSGQAIIALWRYPVRHPAITAAPQLHAALHALLRAARAKDPSLVLERTGYSSVDGDGAVIIDGLERIDGQVRRVRSEHIYVDGAELVLETYAPPAQFAAVDHAVFSPVRKSLMLLNGGRPQSGSAAAARSSSTSAPSAPTP